ncbi:nucleotidyltransferase family protein [Simiduia aestuariiviva]|uniref:MurNAc alpha-1-phosphate uridylyltransferase n=1 Tax=Simiduia aestuariiviva TaxID=1510459 RepID=A0A839UPA2_9GAMM|nr:nucleotidyltransferase family protein [Simiduia aestuariiviva]MBB3167267.1 MurNAc alpha-1-phosphate uridylyltransferase [Simiduia aestuariiviva]
MKAFVFAAGKGTRMRPLTDHTPKPLLTVDGKPLIDYHLEKLAAAGFTEVMINLSYLGDQIRAHCGNGHRYGLSIDYSEEGPEPLETGGALAHCLPWFDGESFAMISADVVADLDYEILARSVETLAQRGLQAELVLTHNPSHHPQGDFGLRAGCLTLQATPRHTYTGIGTATAQFIAEFPERRERFPLREALHFWLVQAKVGGLLHRGQWCDVGTPERLAAIQSAPSA